MDESEKIIQIMPVDNMWGVYRNGKTFTISPILCLALREDGLIDAIDYSSDGMLEAADSVSNFVQLLYSALKFEPMRDYTAEQLKQLGVTLVEFVDKKE